MPETFCVAFFGAIEQQLHADANAEHGLLERGDHFDEARVAQPLHGIRGHADAGQDHPLGVAHDLRIGGHGDGLFQPVERKLNRARGSRRRCR